MFHTQDHIPLEQYRCTRRLVFHLILYHVAEVVVIYYTEQLVKYIKIYILISYLLYYPSMGDNLQ